MTYMPKHRKTTFNMAAAAVLNCRKLLLWSPDLCFHAILHLSSNLHTYRLKWRRDIAKEDFQYGVRPPS